MANSTIAPTAQAADGPSPNPQPSNRAPDPVQVRSLTVKPGRLSCRIAIPDARFRRTTPTLADYVLKRYPDLAHHACLNDEGPTFGAVITHTSTAHLLEHLAISLQTRSTHAPSASFVGTSEWTDPAAGEARIDVSFLDDLEALRAFAEATRFLNIAVLTCLL